MALSVKETQEISSYQNEYNGKLPITFICQNGIIYKNIFMNKHPENSFYHLEGYIEDPISVFLFNHDRSNMIYDSKMKENDITSASAEMDAYRRTRVSDEVIQEFYPNL